MADFKINRGLQENFDALGYYDSDAIYVCVDTGRCYLGSKLLSPRAYKILTSGLKAYYNGVDVTDSPDLPYIVEICTSEWYGSSGAYSELVTASRIVPGVLYLIEAQADWSESDPKKLGYIKNQPNLLNMHFIEESHTLNFFLTKYNQPI